MKKLIIVLLLLIANQTLAGSISEHTKNMSKHPGFFNFYWDQSTGQVLLEIDNWDQEFLYVNYLQSGVGSNDIGLDRGQIGDTRLVQFQRMGHKILLVQPNQTYRAYSDNTLERQAVADGFAQSVLWGGEVVAESNGAVLVNLTDWLLRDSQHISNRLKSMQEGNYQVDPKRSAIYLANTKSFPDNTEFEALITLQGSDAGQHLNSVTPTANAVSVRTHHSFVRLPPQAMKPRVFDPRSGGIPVTFYDYAAPLGESMKKQWVIRHRLETDAQGQVIEPIVYYLDAGTPEPVRSALLDGAKWWSEAFAKAGFPGGYEVKMLPKDADPLDIRYNTIQWVHRSTRGWSYGASVVDPRSGEILKGHVTLGSLRVRQDMLIAQALLSPYVKNGDPKQAEQLIEAMALARLRQLSAHEVGHTIGLIHNFHASSNDRASVMDYPHPLIQLNNNQVDLSDAYDVGIGSWDQVGIDYLYKEFPDQNEHAALQQLLTKAKQAGHVFIADRDARSPGGSHPTAHLWDNGNNAADSLLEVLTIRHNALQRFGLDTIKTGQPLADLERLLVPIYLLHRYQTEAAIKLIGGVNYRYAVKGETDAEAKILAPELQQQALDAVLQTLDVKTLALNQDLLPLLLPPVEGSFRDREHFKHRTNLNFDALGIAETTANHTLRLLLNPARLNRLVEHHARNANNPSLRSVLNQLWQNTWEQKHQDRYLQAVQGGINWVTLQALIQASQQPDLAPGSLATLQAFLQQQQKALKKSKSELAQLAHQSLVGATKVRAEQPAAKPKPIPPGSPIGSH